MLISSATDESRVDSSVTVATPETSEHSNLIETTPDAEDSSRRQDNNIAAMDISDKARRRVEQPVVENIPLIPKSEEPLSAHVSTGNSRENRNLKKISQRLFPRSDNKIHVGFEAVLVELGDPGKFYWIQLFLHMLALFSFTNTMLVYVFTGYEPPHVCTKLDNESIFLAQHRLNDTSDYEVDYGKCSIIVFGNRSGDREAVTSLGCVAGHDYHGEKHISFVSEWDFVCDNVGLTELVQSVLMLGQTAGALVFTSIADKYGRKPVLVACNLLLGGAGFGVAYAPNIYVMIAFRFLCGFFQSGAMLVSMTMRVELLTSKNRSVVSVISGMFWSFSIVVFGLLAYLMRRESWRMLQLAASLFTTNAILSALFLYESPRWLSANKKYTQALAIIKKACQTNQRDYQKVKAVFERLVIQSHEATEQGRSSEESSKVEQYSLLDIVRHKILLLLTLSLCFISFTSSTTYYGLYMISSSLAGDRHLNFILQALSELPAHIANLFLFALFGRKPVMMGWLLLAGTGLLTVTLLEVFGSTQITRALSVVFSCVGLLAIGACNNSVFLYTPELFPTNLRSAGLGVCTSVSRLGGMIAPYSKALADVVLWGPGVIFSAMCFLATILFTTLPETRGQPMPDTITDMKQRVVRYHGNKSTNVLQYEAEILKPNEVNINN